MIIKPMAITRCPYCHAIIDENDKYCNNCGTQLLFPEDDEVDEEIPGEKILDAEVEEKDYTVDEPEDEKRPVAAAEEDLDEELEEDMREEAAEKALDELVAEEELEDEADGATEEVILLDEIEPSGEEDRPRTGEIEDKAGPVGTDETAGEAEEEEDIEAAEEGEEDREEGITEEEKKEAEAEIEEKDAERKRDTGTSGFERPAGEPAQPEADERPPAAIGEEPEVEYLSGSAGVSETEDVPAATAGESAFRPATFDTKDLENLGRTVEMSKDKIDEVIQVLAERKKPAAPVPETSAGPTAEPPRESTGSLPPWASTMKGAPVFPPDTTPVEPKKGPIGASPTEGEVEIFPRRKPSDSTLGLPERLSQAPLPFGEEAGEEGEAEEETREAVRPPAEPERPERPPVFPVREPGRIEAAIAEEAEEAGERPPFSFSVFFKSKAFDLLFVGLFWLVALWLAAHVMGQTLFEVLAAVSGPMLLLYAVFVLLYFFLFKFFLGETLGDRLFRPRD
jgi:hypothetical protein